MSAELREVSGLLLLAMSAGWLSMAGPGCTGSSDSSTLLIGMWTGDPTSMLIAQNSIPEEHRQALEKLPEDARPSMKAVYREDGTFDVSLNLMGMENKASGNWKVIETQGKSIKIQTEMRDNKTTTALDITFKDEDTIEVKSAERPGSITLIRTREG